MNGTPGTGLVDRVYREILGSIIEGEFNEGDKLPTELALAERFTESGAAARAATMASDADLAQIEQRFRELDAVIAEQALGSREDFDFHLAVARACRNQFFVSAIASMQEQVLVSMNLMRNLSLLKSVERQKLVQAEHEVILKALKDRDPAAAALAMRNHLENARNRMFGK